MRGARPQFTFLATTLDSSKYTIQHHNCAEQWAAVYSLASYRRKILALFLHFA